MSLDSLADAFHDGLCDIYHAERQLLKALPKMIKKATDEKLVTALTTHLEETKQQVERVELAFEETEKSPRAKKCDAMAGLIEEAQSMMEKDASPDVMDAILIGLAQKIEHYEIASYGTLCSWANSLGYMNAVEQLGENLAEEVNADKVLTKVSKSVNRAAEAVGR
ncbi:MAG: ferritin-like domain-containing protein [Planctomycetaceae bacterium]|nr:ferritin-like domain-containing protein [Planctomycetaceae bacterium]